MRDAIRRMGLGEEFLGRISHTFIFDSLKPEAVRRILEVRLARLQDLAEVRGYDLEWNGDVISHLSAQWQPRFGVRHLLAMIRNRIVEQLSVADAQGELRNVKKIRLEVAPETPHAPRRKAPGTARRRKDGETLIVTVPRP
jgi:ATP-dependent Clp protease ATP-binding subunit ClpA